MITAWLLGAALAAPYEMQTWTLDDQTTLDVGVVTPASGTVDPRKVAVVLPPAMQDDRSVELALAPWAEQAAETGWLVVAPAKPGGKMWFSGAEDTMPRVMKKLRETWPSVGDRVHLLGISNGGISAFRVGTRFPEQWASITVLPGMPTDVDKARLDRLNDIDVLFVVGAQDSRWAAGAQSAAELMKDKGNPPVLKVVPNQGHQVWASLDWKVVAGWLPVPKTAPAAVPPTVAPEPSSAE